MQFIDRERIKQAQARVPQSLPDDPLICGVDVSGGGGQHAATSTSFYIFDESSAVPDKIFEVAEGGLRSRLAATNRSRCRAICVLVDFPNCPKLPVI